MFIVRLFMIASNTIGMSSSQFNQYEKCSTWNTLDSGRSIKFTDKEGKLHISNLRYEVIEDK